ARRPMALGIARAAVARHDWRETDGRWDSRRTRVGGRRGTRAGRCGVRRLHSVHHMELASTRHDLAPPAVYCYSIYGVRVTSDLPFEFPDAGETDTPLAHVEFTECAEEHFPSSVRELDAGSESWF